MVKRRAWRCPRWECSKKGAGDGVRLGVNASSYHTVLCMHLLLLLEYIMVKEMRILLCLVLMCCMSVGLASQMTAAKKIPPAIEKKIVLKASAQKSVGLHLGAGKLQEVFERERIHLRGKSVEC